MHQLQFYNQLIGNPSIRQYKLKGRILLRRQMDYYKPYCQIHAYEPITNYCMEKDCLVGLCATCVCEHTQMHVKQGTSPSYENIKNTYARINQRIKQQINKIQAHKTWLSDVYDQIKENNWKVKETLGKARKECLEAVNKHFDRLEIKVQIEIVSQSKKNSLHSNYRLDSLNALIIKEISNLLFYSKDLCSPKFLDTARMVETEVLVNSQEFHCKVARELKENQLYTPSVSYRQEALLDFQKVLREMVSLEFQLPRQDGLDLARKAFQIIRPSSHNINVFEISRPSSQNIKVSSSSCFFQKRPNSISKITICPKQQQHQPLMQSQSPKYRNVLLQRTHHHKIPQTQQSSMIYQISPLLQSVPVPPVRNRSEIISQSSTGININPPTTTWMLHKTSKVPFKTSGESIKENWQERYSRMSSSSMSDVFQFGKENQLVYQTYNNSGSNFFR